ncbi:MAG TPA: isoprenyl transferase [Phycisphaerae bacterium]|nr:isoprenyl transferase [Phycisphaerae bacterium]HNU45297.1 isoprenyl transferase [Phycisphaerae bacterium]
MTQTPLDPQQVLGVTRAQLPRHIAIIMDGNGRWAQQRGQPRIRGHVQGAEAVRTVVTQCARLGIEVLTLYSFSTENWSRPRDEVEFLMRLYVEYLRSERPTIMENNVRFVHLGRRAGLPEDVLAEMDETLHLSRDNTGLAVCLALNYGGRAEIVDAVRKLAERVEGGGLQPADIDEACVGKALYTAGLPDPDLLIRTAGQRRISNFLLWQISYAEIHVTETLWPNFGVEDLHAAIRDYAGRRRSFGGTAGSG